MNDIVTIMKAADFAARKHTNQKRKGEGAEPYLNHLIEVASLVAPRRRTGVQMSSSPRCCTTRSKTRT